MTTLFWVVLVPLAFVIAFTAILISAIALVAWLHDWKRQGGRA